VLIRHSCSTLDFPSRPFAGDRLPAKGAFHSHDHDRQLSGLPGAPPKPSLARPRSFNRVPGRHALPAGSERFSAPAGAPIRRSHFLCFSTLGSLSDYFGALVTSRSIARSKRTICGHIEKRVPLNGSEPFRSVHYLPPHASNRRALGEKQGRGSVNDDSEQSELKHSLPRGTQAKSRWGLNPPSKTARLRGSVTYWQTFRPEHRQGKAIITAG